MVSTVRKGESNPNIEVDRVLSAFKQAGFAEKTGSEIMDEAILEPTLDRWLDNSPKVGQPINYPELVTNLQRKRELYIKTQGEKKEKKNEED